MKYRTIVADPPWQYNRNNRTGVTRLEEGEIGHSLPYPTMTVDAICGLPVRDMAEDDSHLYLWTTQRYVWEAPRVAKAWGFKPVKLLVWCKTPHGFSVGGPFGNATEFALLARRGSLAHKTRIPRDWWVWFRTTHSAKPEAFLDVVEQMSPGPYLELFARRNRLGWDTWGNESLEHIAIQAAGGEPYGNAAADSTSSPQTKLLPFSKPLFTCQ